MSDGYTYDTRNSNDLIVALERENKSLLAMIEAQQGEIERLRSHVEMLERTHTKSLDKLADDVYNCSIDLERVCLDIQKRLQHDRPRERPHDDRRLRS